MPGVTLKIWRLKDGRLMGHAGARRHAQKLMNWIENQDGEPPDTKDVTAFVVEHDGSIWVFDGESERTIGKVPYYAIGSGAQAALGALFMGASAADAVKAAMSVDCWTGGEVFTQTVGYR